MELEKFAELLKEQYFDSASIEFGVDTDIRSIESFDSLTGMSMLVVIKDEFDLDIDEATWKTLNTPRDILDYIQSQK